MIRVNTKSLSRESEGMGKTDKKVTSGYKKTEIGIIPEDWEVKRLGEVFRLKSGETKPDDTRKYGKFPVYGGNGILGYSNKHNFNKTTLIIGRVGEYCGSVLLARKGWVTDNALFITSVFKNLSLDFLYYLLIYENLNKYSSETGQPLLTQSIIYDIPIPIPPLSEQCAIARVLSDFDHLIESLDRLVEKKKLIKRGAMQLLLTGKKRLPGFKGEWVRKKLEEIAEITMGQSPDSKDYNDKGLGWPLIQGNADIKDKRTIKRVFTTQLTKFSKKGDIILTVRAPVGEVALNMFDACIGRGVCSLRARFDSLFLFYILDFSKDKWKMYSEGSTYDSVNSNLIKIFEISLPPTLAEQRAIAQILSDMDAEIEALEKKKQKYEMLKKGAMELLLTGKIRLKDHVNEVLV